MEGTLLSDAGASAASLESLTGYAQRLCEDRLAAYRVAPHDVEEHANIETSVLAGGYAYRQVAELVQNAADAIADSVQENAPGRIVIEASDGGLWAANSGAPVDRAGIRALLNAHSSNKRAGQIGRFGLGFKSLLRLGGRIDVLSRTVCLRFDPERCRCRIRDQLGLPPDAPAPALRLADAFEWSEAAPLIDPAGTFDWATTIVFAELRSGNAHAAIVEEIRRFPAEFLLFLSCDTELVLRAGDVHRRLRRRTDQDGCIVVEDLASERPLQQRWRVFQTAAKITDEAAIADATGVHARESVPLIWAAPVGVQREVAGRFYAFFPTATETRTLGILNAPWKLNSDRTAVIPGAWNSALMEKAAELIVARLPELGEGEDPGLVLDAFPRELQTQSEPAAPLVEALWSRLLTAPVLPNCDGELHPAGSLRRAPIDAPDVIALWSDHAAPEACETHLHASCSSTRPRISRLNELAQRLETQMRGDGSSARLRHTSAREWLSAACSTDPEAAADALILAEAYANAVSVYDWDRLRDNLPIILTADLDLATASEVMIAEAPEPPLRRVHPVLAERSDVAAILRERFHVQTGSETDWTRTFDARVSRAESDGDWEPVWQLLRKMPFDEASLALSFQPICVRTLGGWESIDHVIRRRGLVLDHDLETAPEASKPYLRRLLLDEEWHHADELLLRELGLGGDYARDWIEFGGPETADIPGQHWFRGWRERWVDRYHQKLKQRPSRNLLRPERVRMPRGWQLLLFVEEGVRSRIADWLIRMIAEAPEPSVGPVTFFHQSRRNSYEEAQYPHPLWDLLRERGTLGDGDGRLEVGSILSAGFFERIHLVPSLSVRSAGLQRLKEIGGEWTAGRNAEKVWQDWLGYAAHERRPTQELADLYDAAAEAGHVPFQVCSPRGPEQLSDVVAATSLRDAELSRKAGLTAVALSNAGAALWTRAGARSFAEISSVEWTASADPEPTILLLDLEPALEDAVRPDAAGSAAVTFAERISQIVGERTQPVDWALSEGRLLVCESGFRRLPWADRVRVLLEGAAACGWTREGDAVETVLSGGVAARRRAVAAKPDLASRLLAAVGSIGPLLELFETDLHPALSGNPLRTASVALTMYGPALLTLEPVRAAMGSEGLEPPARWGGDAAAEFVAAIGFPPDYAVPPTRKREPELSVSGPLPLRPLHDFQEEVVEALDALIADRASRRRRAVISLPTGAGKTRVAAETAVTRTLAKGSAVPLVLWIAQTDELCEQAVQCFRELWTNVGRTGEALRIVRFWGGQANPRPSLPDEPTVIVASIQTLTSRMIDKDLAWASNPGLIVIDECHHALTPSYTGALRWLNPETEAEGREPPIVGLSATPFRGRNEEESRQLARRFDGRLIPQRQADLFEKLQDRGVLARFGYTRLDINERFELSEEEIRSLETFKRLPESALERLGRNAARNERIVDAIVAAPEKSALVFATSVAHARRLAARLNILGVSAAAVSGETDRSSRRWFIRAFQRGDVRVLCNHSALTTGFDAPATDLIVIARPVFSPSLYMQMVGRGLRGPVNGGKAMCRLLTVQDNLDEYTGALAHHFFERYYL